MLDPDVTLRENPPVNVLLVVINFVLHSNQRLQNNIVGLYQSHRCRSYNIVRMAINYEEARLRLMEALPSGCPNNQHDAGQLIEMLRDEKPLN